MNKVFYMSSRRYKRAISFVLLIFYVFVNIGTVTFAQSENLPALYADLYGIYITSKNGETLDTNSIELLCEGESIDFKTDISGDVLKITADGTELYKNYILKGKLLKSGEAYEKHFYISALTEEDFTRYNCLFGGFTSPGWGNGWVQNEKMVLTNGQNVYLGNKQISKTSDYTVSFDVTAYEKTSKFYLPPSLIVGFNVGSNKYGLIAAEQPCAAGWFVQKDGIKKFWVNEKEVNFNKSDKIATGNWNVGKASRSGSNAVITQPTDEVRNIRVMKTGSEAAFFLNNVKIDEFETSGKDYGYFGIGVHGEEAIDFIDNVLVTKCAEEKLEDTNNIEVSEQGESFVISGTSLKPDSEVTVFVLNDGKNTSDFTQIGNTADFSQTIYFFDQQTVGTDGNFNMSFPRNDAAENMRVLVINGNLRYEKMIKSEDNRRIYVSVAGSDELGDGSLENPFCTIEKAQEAARQILAQDNTGVVVEIGEGEYEIQDTIEFTDKDSGKSSSQKTVYKAIDGERVRLTGAKKIDVSLFEKAENDDFISNVDDSVRSKIVSLDLSNIGIGADRLDIPGFVRQKGGISSKIVMPDFFLNGVEQEISRWPDSGKAQYEVSEINDNGATKSHIAFENKDCSNWKNPSVMLVGGNLSQAWLKTWASVDSAEQSGVVCPAEKNNFIEQSGVSNPIQEAYVYNCPEEITLPGEWCINPDTMKMYYYPKHELTDEDIFEIAFLDDNIISVDGTKNIEFSGLEFEKTAITSANADNNTKANAIFVSNAENIAITNCTINQIGNNGIAVGGNNISIDGCVIYRTGNRGIQVSESGDLFSLESGNVKITNCHISEPSKKNGNNSGNAIGVDRNNVGVRIENNVIHNTWNNAVIYNGMENLIKNNEIYNCMNDSSDGGAIYTGRTWGSWGNAVSENYIHDYGTDKSIHLAAGVYLDDVCTGSTVINNIIYPNNLADGYGIFVNLGQYHKLSDNIIVQGKRAIYYPMLSEDVSARNLDACRETLGYVPYTSTIYMNKYPNIKTVAENYLKSKQLKHDYEVSGNKTVNSSINVSDKTNVRNNTEKKADGFDNLNLQSLTYAAVKNGIVSNDDLVQKYKINDIGITSGYRIDAGRMSFGLTYPENGEACAETDTELSWEKSAFADKYRYMVSEKQDFSELTADGYTADTNVKISGLSKNKKYYWKVTAVNSSDIIGTQKECDNVFFFGTYDSAPNGGIEFGEMKLMKNGAEVTGISELTGKISLNQHIGGNGFSKKVCYVLATYSAGKLCSAKIINKVITPSNGEQTVFEFNADNTVQNADEIKVFCFSDLNNIMPMAKNLTLPRIK